ncbi:putative Glycosyl transferase [Lysobacter dokdonensis DS-58]|uniref:Putative Glycosyl transferase n=2 Tax=Noviluteimonas TaxID=3382693 RepID=A0A0A2WND7_9GAMM|nr:putative Glycosyl transferase [Lysobacter dokdonensis DS-58]
MVPCRGRVAPTDFIYVGRLVASKKVDILLHAFRLFVAVHPESQLHIVGTGDQYAMLQGVVRDHSIPGVTFHGHIAELNDLRAIYDTCVASVSPGYVGLSVTQSFSLGVPMIISRNEPHSPEIECVVDGVNASFFETDAPASLCGEMESWYGRAGQHDDRAAAIAADCKNRYSVERMVAGFVEAVNA